MSVLPLGLSGGANLSWSSNDQTVAQLLHHILTPSEAIESDHQYHNAVTNTLPLNLEPEARPGLPHLLRHPHPNHLHGRRRSPPSDRPPNRPRAPNPRLLRLLLQRQVLRRAPSPLVHRVHRNGALLPRPAESLGHSRFDPRQRYGPGASAGVRRASVRDEFGVFGASVELGGSDGCAEEEYHNALWALCCVRGVYGAGYGL